MSDLSPDLKNRIKVNPKEREEAISEATLSYQERLQRAVNAPLAELGFTPNEQQVQNRIEKAFQSIVMQGDSDCGNFLNNLGNAGFVTINSSQYLKYLRGLRIQTRRFDPDLQVEEAAYVTHQDISSFFEEFRKKLPEAVKEELHRASEGENGVIFLGRHPHPLTKFHEGAHAIQHMQGWNSQLAGKARTEVGVNLILLRSFDQGLLGDVSKGDYYVGETVFAKPRILPKTNDIYKELEDFERNLANSSISVSSK